MFRLAVARLTPSERLYVVTLACYLIELIHHGDNVLGSTFVPRRERKREVKSNSAYLSDVLLYIVTSCACGDIF